MAADRTTRLCVPVQRSVTLRQTVGHAIELVLDAGSSAENPDSPSTSAGEPSPTVHFVFLASWRGDDPGTNADRSAAEELLEQVAVWARYDCEEAGVDPEALDITTTVLGTGEYLFSPDDYANVIASYAADHDLTHVVVDPEYALVGQTTLAAPMELALKRAGLTVTEAPVERPTSRTRFVGRTSVPRFAALFGTSFLFYQVLGGFSGLFDIVTGAITALIVAIALSSVSFYRDPTLNGSPLRVLRTLVYLPYLLYEIIISNLAVASVILDPRLPIDPRLTRIRVVVGSGFPLTMLCNSITLTPGTLTVKANDQELYVHSLLPFAREGLFDGGLERWVRFVFYGREAARFPSPRERGDTEVLQQPAATDGGVVNGNSGVVGEDNGVVGEDGGIGIGTGSGVGGDDGAIGDAEDSSATREDDR